MLAIKEVTKLAAGLNTIAPFMREIHNDNELEQALELMEALIEDYDTNLVVIEALGNAITRFEDTASSFVGFNRSVNESDPAVGTLKVLMEQHNLNTNDFENEIGKKSMVSQVLSGGKSLSRKHIELLSKRFNISPALFFGIQVMTRHDRTVEQPEQFDTAQVAKTSLKVFFNICDKWGLNTDEALRLMGEPSRDTFTKWKQGDATKLTQDQLARVSITLGVYKALRLLFPTTEQAHGWINKPSTHFGGKPAREYFCTGNLTNMLDLRKYLDSVIHAQ